MSTEQTGDRVSKEEGTRTSSLEQSGEQGSTQSQPTLPLQLKENERRPRALTVLPKQKNPFQSSQPSTIIPSATDATASSSVSSDGSSPRQVIAVSASKGPAAFFNLARKFLASDEFCDLSALEGAIVSAVDAAHLLERSQLAHIVRVHTSYVTVEPKRRKNSSPLKEHQEEVAHASTPLVLSTENIPKPGYSDVPAITGTLEKSPSSLHEPVESLPGPLGVPRGRSSGRELRRARIVITVRRTESYTRWLAENPLQAMIANDGNIDAALEKAPGGHEEPE